MSTPIDILVEEDEGFPGSSDILTPGLSSALLEVWLVVTLEGSASFDLFEWEFSSSLTKSHSFSLLVFLRISHA